MATIFQATFWNRHFLGWKSSFFLNKISLNFVSKGPIATNHRRRQAITRTNDDSIYSWYASLGLSALTSRVLVDGTMIVEINIYRECRHGDISSSFSYSLRARFCEISSAIITSQHSTTTNPQQSKTKQNHVHISWDILCVCKLVMMNEDLTEKSQYSHFDPDFDQREALRGLKIRLLCHVCDPDMANEFQIYSDRTYRIGSGDYTDLLWWNDTNN